MLFLALSILCSTALGFIFKMFARYNVDIFQAILFNYWTCVACATIHLGHFPITTESTQQSWWPYALGLGLIFVTGFNLAAQTVRLAGVTVSQIMQKMTVLASVPFAILCYQEAAGAAKILGVLCSVAAIVLVNWPKDEKGLASNLHGKALLVLAFTWLLSAMIDMTFIKLDHEKKVVSGDIHFVATIFGCAGSLALLAAIVGWLTGRLTFSWRNVIGGILLGIPNYGSILFILLALGTGMEGSVFFPLNNMGIIVASAIGATLLFSEKMTRINWFGIAMAVAAIALISI